MHTPTSPTSSALNHAFTSGKKKKKTCSVCPHMQHRQRRSFTHLNTGHHSYSPRHENRACSLSVGFSEKPQLIELGPSLPKSNRWTEIYFVRWLVMKWGDHTAVVLLPNRYSAAEHRSAPVAPPLSLKFVFYVSIESISLVNANTSQQALPPLFYDLIFLCSILIWFFPTAFVYSFSPLWFYFLASHYPISFFCSLSGKMYLWIWLM